MQGIRRPATAPTSGPMNAPAVTQAGASGVPMQGARRSATAPTNGPMNAPAVTQPGASGAPPVSGKAGQGESGGGGVVSAADQRLLEALFPDLISSLKDLGYAQDREVFRDSILKLRTQKLRPPVQ